MGREIKRIALDFDYPITGMIWRGYHNPYSGMECRQCEGSGQSPQWHQLSEDWYDFAATGRKWCYAITQDEVDALWEGNRLQQDFKEKPTQDVVNEWARHGMGHDAINRWICVETRAKRLGYKVKDCMWCEGHGSLWPDDKYRQLRDDFEYIEPPEGLGYQLWETTSEGSPTSPVFAEPEDLAQWLVDNNASTFGRETTTYDNWLAFIRGPGWAPSMMGSPGNMKSGVDAVAEGAGSE